MFRNRLNISYLIKTMCSIRGTSFFITLYHSATYRTRQIGRILLARYSYFSSYACSLRRPASPSILPEEISSPAMRMVEGRVLEERARTLRTVSNGACNFTELNNIFESRQYLKPPFQITGEDWHIVWLNKRIL